MEEEARSKSAIIFIFHKVFREFFCRMFMDCETAESICHPSVIPEAPLQSQQRLNLSSSVLITSQEGKKYSFQDIHVPAKKLRIFNSTAQIRRKRSDGEISTNVLLLSLGQKTDSSLFGQSIEEILHSRASFQDTEKRHLLKKL